MSMVIGLSGWSRWLESCVSVVACAFKQYWEGECEQERRYWSDDVSVSWLDSAQSQKGIHPSSGTVSEIDPCGQ
eukprot:3741203-Amphidinium_carterae.1